MVSPRSVPSFDHMPIFAVLALPDSAWLEQAVPAAYRDDFKFRIAPGHWLVNSIGTSQDVSHRLGFGGHGAPASNSGIVYGVSGYFGNANPQIWEWLTANWSRPGV